MKNRIDLKKYDIRTDLLIETIDNKIQDKISKIEVNKDIKVTTITVDKSISKELSKKEGKYITIEFTDITNYEDRIEIEKIVSNEIKKLLKDIKVQDNDNCLIIGLGNSSSTADSLGPKTIDNILVTRHLFELKTNIKEGIRNVAAFSPGVMANTGIETKDIIESLVKKIKPSFIIVIDALASSSISRINKTIQITDTGISPGSGIGNNRKELSINTLNIPVIAIGVPTVVESSIIVNDTINYLFKHLSYIKNNYEKNKLTFTRKNYLSKLESNDLTEEEKKEVSGLLGSLPDQDKKSLINEVLTNIDYNLIVTPKEIDFLVDKLSETISNGINTALHKEVELDSMK